MDSLFKINEREVKYRFNDVSGPKYLLRGPNADFGLVVLMPGEDFKTHYHDHIEENFFTLEGFAEIHVNDRVICLEPGDLCHLPPNHPHYLVNKGDRPWKAVFFKAPFDEKDKVDVQWQPGDENITIK